MRFRIRNLVLAFTALAILWHVIQLHYRCYRLVEDLQEFGAEVEFDHENRSWFTRGLGSVLPDSAVLTVKSIRFPNGLTRPFDYTRLRQLKLLQELELTTTLNLDELDLVLDSSFLDHLQHLKSLDIVGISVDSSLMKRLVCHPSLETVSFLVCFFEQLDNPPEIENGTNTRLQTITINMSSRGEHLVEWLNQFQGLRELEIGSTPLSDDELLRFSPSPIMERFAFRVKVGISPEQQQALQAKFPNADMDVWVDDDRDFIRFKLNPGTGTFEIVQPKQ